VNIHLPASHSSNTDVHQLQRTPAAQLPKPSTASEHVCTPTANSCSPPIPWVQFKLQLQPNNLMGISWLPTMAFDPSSTTSGAAGAEAVINPTDAPGVVNATFDLSSVVLPDLNHETTFIYGRNIRLPPFMWISLHPTKMQVSPCALVASFETQQQHTLSKHTLHGH
jgi:hypothetical protein